MRVHFIPNNQLLLKPSPEMNTVLYQVPTSAWRNPSSCPWKLRQNRSGPSTTTACLLHIVMVTDRKSGAFNYILHTALMASVLLSASSIGLPSLSISKRTNLTP